MFLREVGIYVFMCVERHVYSIRYYSLKDHSSLR